MKFLVLAATLAAGSAQAATLDYKFTFNGQIPYLSCNDVFRPCDDDSEESRTPFLLEVSYLPYDISESIVDGEPINGPRFKFSSAWKQVASLSLTIKGVTVSAVGFGDASWRYDLCRCYYGGENFFNYQTDFSGVSGGTPVSLTFFMNGYRYLEEVPARGPLFHSFSSTPESSEVSGLFTFGDLSIQLAEIGDSYDSSFSFEATAPVPLPASLPLFVGGLLALFAVRRMQRGTA
jgi:hypothetical protein